MALPAAVTDPASSAGTSARAERRICRKLAYIGTASATVAGPSRNCTYCAPWKYTWYGVPVTSSRQTIRPMAISIGLASVCPPSHALIAIAA